MFLGLDLGSTGPKFATSAGLVGKIPGVVGNAEEIWKWEEDYIQLEHKGRQRFVGRAAMEQSENPLFALQNNKMERQTVEELLHAALAYVAHVTGEGVFDVVATLPFDATAKQKESLLKMLEDASSRQIYAKVGGVKTSGKVSIRRKHLVPEGYAGWCNFVLGDDGSIKEKDLARRRVCVNDLGLFHFSQLVVDAMVPQGKPVSISTSLGLSHAHVAASRQLGGIEVWKVDRGVLSGDYDVADVFESYAGRINQETINFEARQGGSFPFHYWTGGGIHAIGKWLTQPRKAMAEDGPMDNALGAVKVARRRWGEK